MTLPITGVAKIVSAGAPCYAILIKETDGTVVATTQCAANGSYTFTNPPVGHLAIAFIDASKTYRGEIIHVAVNP